MKENPTDMRNCPSFEDVSAFLDHELDPASPAYAHITACPECQRRLDAYRKINRYLNTAVQVTPPEGLNDRIKAALVRENKLIRFPNLNRGLRLAAAFTVCCGVVFYVLMDNTRPPAEPIGNDREPAVQSPDRKMVPEVARNDDDAAVASTPARDSEFISAGSLVGASYGNSDTPVFTDAMAAIDRNRKAVDIAAQVQQVWSVKDADKTEALLSGLMKKMQIPEKNVRITVNGNNVRLIAGLTKLELIHLVRACRACGLELLSPTAPQPEQNVFVGNANNPVVYYAEFVAEK